MTTNTDTESVAKKPRHESRYSGGWSLSVTTLTSGAVLLDAFRSVDDVIVSQQISLPVAAAQALASALDDLLYGPPEKEAAA